MKVQSQLSTFGANVLWPLLSGHSNNTGDLAKVNDVLALCMGAMVNGYRMLSVAPGLKITTEYENMKESA